MTESNVHLAVFNTKERSFTAPLFSFCIETPHVDSPHLHTYNMYNSFFPFPSKSCVTSPSCNAVPHPSARYERNYLSFQSLNLSRNKIRTPSNSRPIIASQEPGVSGVTNATSPNKIKITPIIFLTFGLSRRYSLLRSSNFIRTF